jgi:hypothetical protein
VPSDRRDFFRSAFLGAGLVTGTGALATAMGRAMDYGQMNGNPHSVPLRPGDITRRIMVCICSD